ncbi:splicing factor 1-like, partial [Anopheles moucheti]|uniref:splicing factor 1-like n=1 Tax=Anopheles moucheti TaxID=186751 RepID=UPI0022F02150
MVANSNVHMIRQENHECEGLMFAQNSISLRLLNPTTASSSATLQQALIEQHNGTSCSLVGSKDDSGEFGSQSISNGTRDEGGESSRRRKKKSRWSDGDHLQTFFPTLLPSTLTPEQQEAYLLQLQIEEISYKLRTSELMIQQNLAQRSPSPEPIYSSDGKRVNTREYRLRKKLEEQRHQLIQRMQLLNPDYNPPANYKPPVIRIEDKVLIPQDEYPHINFVGLLIGPRGNTLKTMEKDTGAKITIRGKGSVKQGKIRRQDGPPLLGGDEPLHAFITASNHEVVQIVVNRIKEMIRQSIEEPEQLNDVRQRQLRELAQLNGTLREKDGSRCNNCGSNEHKSWLCPNKQNNIVCLACGGIGHITRDCSCKQPGHSEPSETGGNCASMVTKFDEEYMNLLAELDEVPPPQDGYGVGTGNGSGIDTGGIDVSRERYNKSKNNKSRSPPQLLKETPYNLPFPMDNNPQTSTGDNGFGTDTGSISSYANNGQQSLPLMSMPPILLSQTTSFPPTPAIPSLMQWTPRTSLLPTEYAKIQTLNHQSASGASPDIDVTGRSSESLLWSWCSSTLNGFGLPPPPWTAPPPPAISPPVLIPPPPPPP